MEEDNGSIKDTLKKIMENQEELLRNKEIKKVKLPSAFKLSRARIKKNWVTAIIINENRTLEAIKVPVEDGTIKIDGIPRISTTDYIMNWKNKPIMIIPSWSLKPFSPEEHYEQTVRDQMTTTGRKLLIAKMKHDVIAPKKAGFGMIGWIILIGIIAAAGFYLIKGGKLF